MRIYYAPPIFCFYYYGCDLLITRFVLSYSSQIVGSVYRHRREMAYLYSFTVWEGVMNKYGMLVALSGCSVMYSNMYQAPSAPCCRCYFISHAWRRTYQLYFFRHMRVSYCSGVDRCFRSNTMKSEHNRSHSC